MPANAIAMAQNTLGIETPMGKDMFSSKEQEAIINLIKIAEEKKSKRKKKRKFCYL